MIGDAESGFETGRDGGAAAAGQPAERPTRPRSGARGRQHQFAGAAAEGDQRDMVTASVTIGEQHFDGALDLGEPAHRQGARGVDDENGRRALLLAVPPDTEIFRLDDHPPRVVWSGFAQAQLAPRRGGAQGRNQRQPSL